MKKTISCNHIIPAIVGVAALMLAANSSPAQVVTNALDVASSYTGTGFTGNQGYGFGAWTLNTPGGGDYISGDNPANFGIWNNTANSATTAERTFNSALTVGETFAVQLMLNNLDSSSTINALELQNSSGTVLFSYWHQGGDSNNGWYSDAAVTAGTATGFSYDYQQLDSLAFTLTSPTTYTFADLSTGASLTGTLAGPVDEVTFLRSNESSSSPSNGQDFKFNTLEITSVPEPASVSFAALGFSLMLAFRRRLA